MPIFDFACARCGHRFEDLVLGTEETHCPECRSADVEKQFSSFSVGAHSPSLPSAGSCGTCGDPRGPGACSTAD